MADKKARIIVVEDEVLGEDVVDEFKYEGFSVFRYLDSKDVIDNLDELDYDLAIVDRSIPDSSFKGIYGDELIEYLKDKYPSKPIICISAYSKDQRYKFSQERRWWEKSKHRTELKIRREDRYIQKPIWIDDLVKIVEELLNKRD
jgi:DNA-binding NtrC family response regulator